MEISKTEAKSINLKHKYMSVHFNGLEKHFNKKLVNEVGSNFKKKYQVLNFLPDERDICSGLKNKTKK